MIQKSLLIALLAVSAVAVTAGIASARSGRPAGSSVGSTAHIGAITAPKADRPTFNFTKMKLLNCHKHPRGNGQGGVIWVTVCT